MTPLLVVKEQRCLGLGQWHLVPRRGDVEHKVQRPAQQLGQCPDRPGNAKCFETPHAQRVSLTDNLLIIAVGAFTGAASPIEIMPRFGATLNRANEAWVIFETHAVIVAQNAGAVRAAPLLLGGTLETADILSALRLVVVAIGSSCQSATPVPVPG